MYVSPVSSHDDNFRDNMVDYADETETYYMFRFFDKNDDGYIDFEE